MIQQLLFSDSLPVTIKKSLDLRSERQSVISSNIANSETPGYKAVDIRFEDELRDAMKPDRVHPKVTHPGHIGGDPLAQIKSVKPEIVVDTSPGKLDGNNVKMENEVVNLNENSMMYSASIQALIKQGGIIRSAIVEGR